MLTSGTRLGTYEIVSPLGAGGMGEVYRAHDTRLKRDVALKILPELFATDPERLARFRREAQLLASLNHSNIGAIHGFEDSAVVEAGVSRPVSALVLELIDGPTLADRIAQGPLPFEEALPIARQIAEALEAAHEQGVIHRDLKPANIKVRPDGTVKVLDFGLAKAFEGEAATSHVSQSPTLSIAATHVGVILGTAAYMAPEQARGRRVDKRADIWAFGCVLFEMVAGKQAFEGEDVSEILAAVIKGSADLERLPPDTHPGLRTLIARCLEKDVRRRMRDIGDVRQELERIEAGPPTAVSHDTGPAAVTRRVKMLMAAAVALTAIVAGGAAWLAKPAPVVSANPTGRFSYSMPAGRVFRNSGRPVVAVSPDGSQFVYNAGDGVYLRSMDALTDTRIQGTEESLTSPFFSPDGRWIGFFSTTDAQLKKIPVSGGTPVVVGAAASNPYGVTWGDDDTILFGQPQGIMRISASGGMPELLVAPADKAEQLYAPQILPGGEWLLFSMTRGAGDNRWDTGEIVAQSLESGERKVLWRGGSDARYVSTGHLVYAVGNGLFAVGFDLARMTVAGVPTLLVGNVQRAPVAGQQTGTAQYAVSTNGTLIHVVNTAASQAVRTLAWVDRSGAETALGMPERLYVHPRLSPDGTNVAVDIRDGMSDIWIWSLVRRTLTRLTFDEGVDTTSVWTADGRRIIFSSQGDNASRAENLYWQSADGSGGLERLTESPYPHFPSSSSADGRLVFFTQSGGPGNRGMSTGTDVMLIDMAAGRSVTPLVAGPFFENNADVAPGGRWVAYSSNESGRVEVYVRAFPDTAAGRWQISTGGGAQPLWSKNGQELFYVDPAGAIVGVSVTGVPTFTAGTPQVIVQSGYATTLAGYGGRMYDVSPDGKRFLVIKSAGRAGPAEEPLAREIVVVQNWFEELKRLVPVN